MSDRAVVIYAPKAADRGRFGRALAAHYGKALVAHDYDPHHDLPPRRLSPVLLAMTDVWVPSAILLEDALRDAGLDQPA